MVDKRSLRSSKKDSQDTPAAEEEKPKPTRTRSKKTKKQETTASGTEEESTSVPAGAPQSEDVVMQTDPDGAAAPEKANEEDVEMKNADEEAKEAEEEVPKEDPTASPLTRMLASNRIHY